MRVDIIIPVLNKEKGIFMRGLAAWIGYHTMILPHQQPDRIAGTSQYSLRCDWSGAGGMNKTKSQEAPIE
jgi:hypothetical protein